MFRKPEEIHEAQDKRTDGVALDQTLEKERFVNLMLLRQKPPYCVMPFAQNVQNWQIHLDGGRGGGLGEMEVTAEGHGGVF